MLVKELKELLKGLDDNAVVTVVDEEQDNAWELIEGRTTDGDSSYLDLVIEITK